MQPPYHVNAARVQPLSERIDTITALATLTGRPIDLIDLHTVGEPLLGQILRHGTRLTGSDTRFGQLIARHFFETEDFMHLQRFSRSVHAPREPLSVTF